MKEKNDDYGSYLTTADIAHRFNVTVDSVRRWVRSGRLTSIRFHRRHLYREADVAKLLPTSTKG